MPVGNCPDFEIALAPANAGPFTVPHGLGHIPCLVLVQMASDGVIFLVEPRYDGTNIYLSASAGGIAGYAQVWG